VAKINLALSSLPSFRALGSAPDATRAMAARIHIGDDLGTLERAFDAAKYGQIPDLPFLELTIPSVPDPSLAPPGCHVMSIYAQFAPYHLRQSDWETERERLGDGVVKVVAEHAPGFERLIVRRQVLAPVDLEASWRLTGGHLFHGEPSLDQLFLFRPLPGLSRYRSPIRGLYLCGSGTHPGLGTTGCSGANASREILHDLRTGR
jgi:phytoene dehydrogenase-like protein